MCIIYISVQILFLSEYTKHFKLGIYTQGGTTYRFKLLVTLFYLSLRKAKLQASLHQPSQQLTRGNFETTHSP